MKSSMKIELKFYMFVVAHLAWFFFTIYVAGFSDKDSILREDITGLFVLLYMAIMTYGFYKFLTSAEVERYERAKRRISKKR